MQVCQFKTIKYALLLALSSCLSVSVTAQEKYPSKTITIINPNLPGGFVDNVARNLAVILQKNLKQTVIIVNKPGANGAIGHAAVANASPDGYTLLITSPSLVTQPAIDALYNRTPIYTLNKLIPISQITSDPAIILANPESNIKTMQDLVKAAGKSPGNIAIASSGTYGATHLPMAMIENVSGVKFKHIPTGGGAGAMTLALGGHVQALASAPSVAHPQSQAGKMVALAQTGSKRLPPYMDLPTLKESNINVEYTLWTTIFAPAETPEPIVRQLTQALRESVRDEQFKTALFKGNSTLDYLDGDAMNQFWKMEIKKLQDTVQQIGKTDE
ncbi:tripartite tricarboxylate transporter substrate binding protein [Polynucleobacter kasalickyi]|uniref:Tripartite-type tricarboxylate transporter, receptor component TctC n=1 Tax=Polynucleobacter kasalickyi TaxID=1938817 RepID=A0A1W2AML9_9BURK|nr:tripartite tricarboxylate transporter substrate binding protein [Polynucleobacter kasalickyi]SMC61478.1 Tripartite-type tricarboxylate transporter, receptor component TctC [Polynucleobacter kasalickyi]